MPYYTTTTTSGKLYWLGRVSSYVNQSVRQQGNRVTFFFFLSTSFSFLRNHVSCFRFMNCLLKFFTFLLSALLPTESSEPMTGEYEKEKRRSKLASKLTNKRDFPLYCSATPAAPAYASCPFFICLYIEGG